MFTVTVLHFHQYPLLGSCQGLTLPHSRQALTSLHDPFNPGYSTATEAAPSSSYGSVTDLPTAETNTKPNMTLVPWATGQQRSSNSIVKRAMLCPYWNTYFGFRFVFSEYVSTKTTIHELTEFYYPRGILYSIASDQEAHLKPEV